MIFDLKAPSESIERMAPMHHHGEQRDGTRFLTALVKDKDE